LQVYHLSLSKKKIPFRPVNGVKSRTCGNPFFRGLRPASQPASPARQARREPA